MRARDKEGKLCEGKVGEGQNRETEKSKNVMNLAEKVSKFRGAGKYSA